MRQRRVPFLQHERWLLAAAKITALSSLIGSCIGAFRSVEGAFFTDAAFGALIGIVIALGCSASEFLLFSNPSRQVARRLRPIVLMLLRGAVYSVVIVFGLALPGMLTDAPFIWEDPAFAEVFVISALVAYGFSIGFEMTRLLGPEATKALIWGKYRRARLENRIILFADVVGSTALAERIGQLSFHDFLRDVAQDLAGSVEKTRGEVHKYVGDSVIVTWPFAAGIADDACLVCARDMILVLHARDAYYLQTYGTEARLRVGIHCGDVAAGEIGDWKKEIALLGDPMNTAARIEGAAKSFKVDIAVSDDVARHLSADARSMFSKLPAFRAAGKSGALVLWSAPSGT